MTAVLPFSGQRVDRNLRSCAFSYWWPRDEGPFCPQLSAERFVVATYLVSFFIGPSLIMLFVGNDRVMFCCWALSSFSFDWNLATYVFFVGRDRVKLCRWNLSSFGFYWNLPSYVFLLDVIALCFVAAIYLDSVFMGTCIVTFFFVGGARVIPCCWNLSSFGFYRNLSNYVFGGDDPVCALLLELI